MDFLCRRGRPLARIMPSPLFESQVQQKEVGVAHDMCRTQLVIEIPPNSS